MTQRLKLRTTPRSPLTPEALETLERVARTGSFAGAARELGKVPSALTYSMRALEEALDVLLFDRSSRQARLTPAGQELLREGSRLLRELDSLATRVKRVATGWETAFTVALDGVVALPALLDLAQGFYAQEPPTQLILREEILSGTWEALLSGAADLAIGVVDAPLSAPQVEVRALGTLAFVFVVAPGHALARLPQPLAAGLLVGQRAVAVADSARDLTPMTIGLLPGQQVLTVPTMRHKVEAIARGLGCGWLPEPIARPWLADGRLVPRQIEGGRSSVSMGYAWRRETGPAGRAMTWWREQLAVPAVRRRLLDAAVLA